MNDLEITFEHEPDVELRGLIRKTLRELVDPATVPHAHVIRLIGDGRSGATVFEVSLRKGQEDRRWVVKVGPEEEMANEVERYKKYIDPQRPVACAPIVGHTATAVAYQHVADFAGLRTEVTPTLEEVVRSAYEGDKDALRRLERVLPTLFAKLRAPLYDRRQDLDTASLRTFNPRLGPDLRLEPADLRRDPITNVEAIFDITTGAVAGYYDAEFDIERHSVDGVSIRTEDGCEPSGRAVEFRFAERREQLNSLRHVGTPIAAEPSSGLRRVLTDSRFGRARSVGHGDLNPRNILLVRNDIYVIDFAETGDGLPVFWDPAWLEVGLMRDVFSDVPHAHLVRVQRVLALACRLRGLVHESDQVEAICTGLIPDHLVIPFKVLLKLRWHALELQDEADSWENYLALLYFSAYRTLKWSERTTNALRATHAILAVCSEWLVTNDPFQCWNATGDVLAAVEPLLDLTKPEAIKLAAGLMTGEEPKEVVASLGAKLAGLQFHQAALDNWLELTAYHDHYIDLPAVIGDEATGDLVEQLRSLPVAILVGQAGSGKTRTIMELTYRLAQSLVQRLPVRMPHVVTDAQLPDVIPEALQLGAVHLMIEDATEHVLARAKEVHAKYPHMPILVVMRETPQNPEWPVVRMRPMTTEEALEYVRRPVHRLDDRQKRQLEDIIAARLSPISSPALLRLAIKHVQRYGNIKSIEEVYGNFFRAGYGEDHDAKHMMAELTTLNTASTEEITVRARSFEWRNTALLAARLPETQVELLETIVQAVWADDPQFAAELLAARALPMRALIDRFVADQLAVLADTTAGGYNHYRAAESLAELGAERELSTALTAQHAVPQVLQALHGLWLHRTTAEERPGRERALRETFFQVLVGAGHPTEVKNAVLDSISEMRLSGLELVVADLVPDSASALTAAETLLQLGVVRTERLAAMHTALRRDRLKELDALLPTLVGSSEIRAAAGEREHLVRALEDPAGLESYRRSYGVADTVARILEIAPLTWQEMPEATPENAEELALYVRNVANTSPLDGLRLGWEITRTWKKQQVQQRFQWPWLSLMHGLRGSSEDLSELIEQDETGRELGILALSCRDYHRTAARPPLIRLTPGATSALLDRRDHDGTEWALAVAVAGLTDALPHLITMIERQDAGDVVTVANGMLGLVEVRPLDDVRATTGLLARSTSSATHVHELLRSANSLTGLAYLGDWEPLASSDDETVLLAAAGNALTLWAPGPCTPGNLAERGAAARWFDDALRTDDLSPDKRSLFGQLKASAERRDGHLVQRLEPDQEGKGSQPTP